MLHASSWADDGDCGWWLAKQSTHVDDGALFVQLRRRRHVQLRYPKVIR